METRANGFRDGGRLSRLFVSGLYFLSRIGVLTDKGENCSFSFFLFFFPFLFPRSRLIRSKVYHNNSCGREICAPFVETYMYFILKKRLDTG